MIGRTAENGKPDQMIGESLNDQHNFYLRDGMGGHAGLLIDHDSDAETYADGSFIPQTRDAFGVQHDTYNLHNGLYAWRGQEGSRSGFDIGFVEMQARAYDPSIGRFLQEDTLPIASITTQGMNRFIYCENDPVNRSDATGMFWNYVFGTLYILAGVGLMIAATAALTAFVTGSAAKGPAAPLLALAATAAFLATMFAGLYLIMLGLAMLFPAQRCELLRAASVVDAASDILSAGGIFSPTSLNRIISAVQLAMQGVGKCGRLFLVSRGSLTGVRCWRVCGTWLLSVGNFR